nr:Uncharacterised protein [Klebsiella pneumoniae]
MILRPDAPASGLSLLFICDKMVRHWLLSPSAGEISASSAAAGVTRVASAAATAPRTISGPAFTPPAAI